MAESWDAVVVGSGPNGLAAACTLAQAGRSVLVLEAESTIGGGTRTQELTEPGFFSDVCSAIHPMGAVSPFFRSIELERHGLEWIHPDVCVAHPFDDGDAALLHRDVERTADSLGKDGKAYRSLVAPFVRRVDDLIGDAMRPLRIPSNPILMARFGLRGLLSVNALAKLYFRSERARALVGGIGAHAVRPLGSLGSASIGLMLLVVGHRGGWPIAKGGSRAISDAMERYLTARGGQVRVNHRVSSLADIPDSKAVLFDLAPRQVSAIAGDALPSGYKRSLDRFRHGPGTFKVDWSLDGPIPWKNEACRRAGTVHLIGDLRALSESEYEVSHGRLVDKPYVLVAQQSLFDATRAPAGKHVGWGYCHMPSGSPLDATEHVEAQIERFAPGFRDLVRVRRTIRSSDYESHNASMIGGDVNGGANDLFQLIARPVLRWDPYSTPNPRLYLCGNSAPPGGGVHGMSGYHGARSALRRVLR